MSDSKTSRSTDQDTMDVFRELLERTRRIEQFQSQPAVQPLELRTFDDLERWAERAARSDMMPYGYKGKPDNIILAVQMGAELGLRPMQALQNIAIINGRPSVWGDAMLALCMTHPAYVSCREWFSGDGEVLVAHCEVVRKGEPAKVQSYGVVDAKVAKLWNKKGRDGQDTPWVTNPKRMLQMRARGFALRDAFPDRLRGLISAEEASDNEVLRDTTSPQHAGPAISAAGQAAPAVATEKPKKMWSEFLDALEADFAGAQTADQVDAILARPDVVKALDAARNGHKERLTDIVNAAIRRTDARTTAAEPDAAGEIAGMEV